MCRAEVGVTLAGEREVRDRRRDAEVHADVARLDLIPERTRVSAARGVDGGRVAERSPVRDADGLLQVLDADDHRDRAEDLVLADRHVRRAVVEHRRRDEVALEAGHVGLTPVEEKVGAFLEPALDIAVNAIEAPGGDDRAHIDRLVETGARGERTGSRHELLFDLVVDVAHGQQDGGGQAPLTGAAEEAGHHVAERAVDLGVGHDGDEVLGAAVAADALADLATTLVDELGDRRGADEADSLHLWRVEDRP